MLLCTICRYFKRSKKPVFIYLIITLLEAFCYAASVLSHSLRPDYHKQLFMRLYSGRNTEEYKNFKA